MSRLESLENVTQLHESIRIIYVVDGYIATLATNDDRQDVASAHGATILQALLNLQFLLAKHDLNDLESVRSCETHWTETP